MGITQKVAFVSTNAMLVLSDKHMKNLDEIHRGFNHPYEKPAFGIAFFYFLRDLKIFLKSLIPLRRGLTSDTVFEKAGY